MEALLASGVDLVCVTGGLGPTYDDVTMQAVAEATGRRLRVFTDALALVEMRSRGVRRQMQVTDAQLDAAGITPPSAAIDPNARRTPSGVGSISGTSEAPRRNRSNTAVETCSS